MTIVLIGTDGEQMDAADCYGVPRPDDIIELTDSAGSRRLLVLDKPFQWRVVGGRLRVVFVQVRVES